MTTQSKFTVGSYWRTRDGRKARVLANDLLGTHSIAYNYAGEAGDWVTMVRADGRYYDDREYTADLIEPWVDPPAPPPPPRKLYPAVYKTGARNFWLSDLLFESEEQARESYRAIGCQFVCLGPAVEVPVGES